MFGLGYGFLFGLPDRFKQVSELSYSSSLQGIAFLFGGLFSSMFPFSFLLTDKQIKAAEMVLTSGIKPFEYIFSKWINGVFLGIVTAYTYLIVYTLLTLPLYEQYGNISVWLYVLLIAIIFASLGVTLGIIFTKVNLLRKILLIIFLMVLPILLFVLLFIISNTGIFLKFLIPILLVYSLLSFFLSVRNVEIKDFVA
jgi:ABC-type multidrug transport system permease subunit